MTRHMRVGLQVAMVMVAMYFLALLVSLYGLLGPKASYPPEVNREAAVVAQESGCAMLRERRGGSCWRVHLRYLDDSYSYWQCCLPEGTR